MALLWKDKIDGVDRIKAADINAMAHAIIGLENNAEMSGDGGMVFKGVVSELPETANEGEVYKVTTESVATKKLCITVSGVNSIVQNPTSDDSGDYTGDTQLDIDENAPIYIFLAYARDGMYSEYGESFNSYVIKNGVKYSLPWITTMSFGDDYNDILMNTNKEFESLLTNGNVLTCYSDDMTYLPDSLKQYYIKYPAGTCFVYHNGEWVEISKDGVTKAEMESYIEETLLGGEW